MIQTEGNFKVGKMIGLQDLKFQIKDDQGQLLFQIEGNDIEKKHYSLMFTANLSMEELLSFPLHIHQDFIKYVDSSDIVFENDGVYAVDEEVQMDLMQYLPRHFLLTIKLESFQDLVGIAELSFSFPELSRDEKV